MPTTIIGQVAFWASGFVLLVAFLHLLDFLLLGLIKLAGLWLGWALFITLTGGLGVVVMLWSLANTKENAHAAS